MNDTKQRKGLGRNTIDKFYTKREIVEQFISVIRNNIIISDDDLIIEPSAGNGAFIQKIKEITNNYLFYDIEPASEEIIKQDFLEYNHDDIKQQYKQIHIIGNPPFGRQSSLAIKFIKKCCEFANSISFILPKSFKKDSMKRHFAMNFHLIYESELPENSFLVNDNEHNVPCIFQIWIRKEIPRKLIKKLKPKKFMFVKQNENPDISFRRVGINAGTISTEIEDKSTQSHYFIKFTNDEQLDENIKTLSAIKFDTNNTVGPKSISKQEIIKEFNKLIH